MSIFRTIRLSIRTKVLLLALGGGVVGEARGCEQVRAQRHDGQEPHHRIGAAAARSIAVAGRTYCGVNA